MLRYVFELFSGDLGFTGTLFVLACLAFTAWMFVHAVRNGEYIWAALIFFFSIFTATFYYFLVYRPSGGTGNPLTGFELPGAADRRRIKQLEADIHHLDKAHLHLQLADIYFSQGKLEQAEASYRAAYERDPKDEDIRAHLGNCLAREGRTGEALPLLQAVGAQNPKHDYGYTLMTLAETQAAVGQKDEALRTWRQVLGMYSYARAKVQYAQLLIERGQKEEARKILEEVLADEPYGAKFQRQREAVWVRKARRLSEK
jgi:tetratricopeptide (TPR) repeat protein